MTGELQTRSGMFCVETGQGAPVVLVHGAFSDYRAWDPQVDALATSHRALSVSLRGYYPSQDRIGDATAERHVEDLVDLIAELAAPVVLIGHSRGGRIALDVAARCGTQIHRLVLVEPGGVMEPDFLREPPSQAPAAPDIRLEVGRLIAAGKADTALETYVDFGHGAGTWKRLPASFHEMAIANAHTIGMMIDDGSVPLSRALARKVTAPTLLIGGSASPPIFPRTMAVLQAELPKSSTVTIDGGDHFLTMCKTPEVNQALAAFIRA
ncbi:alpha/beta hydrolase [Roseiarcaceae bacterium H3SJ34-1]|uniref:alpha/beta fold hydrolase n=1 Tax=Terripilifer ovatus TaxID=3032367 RepID=UPI003AB988C5|nr:alpha/beta hydrolase [Roseiarcaceae bacterium H3SJ34-1]